MKKYLLLFFIYFSSLEAAPVSFNFFQDGFDEGAIVTGGFTGDDINNDRRISESEIIDFSMEFSGNNIVPAFSIKFPDIRVLGFGYDLDGGPLGNAPDEGVTVLEIGFSYQDVPSPEPDLDPGISCEIHFADCGVVFDGGSRSNSFQLVQLP